MKLSTSTIKYSGRIFSKKVFASHMYTLLLLLLMFCIVVASTKAAGADGAEDPSAPVRRSPVTHETSPEAEAIYKKAVDLEKAGKIDRALKHYEEAAALGYPRAQYNLANHYYEGKVVSKNIDRAMKLFTDAAESGHTRAQFNLASILERGKVVPKDEILARYWYTESAKGGFARAASQLGVLWEEGRGGDVDEDQAVVYYQQAAAADEPAALNNLGRLSLLSIGGLSKTEEAEEEAIEYFTRAAELGFAPAQVNLGHIYENHERYAEALDCYLKAAASKNDKAYYFLGVLYEDGLGTKKNPKKAHELYGLAAPVSDGMNYTALQLAAKDGRLDAVKTMLEAGADVDAGNRDGMTALKLAIKYSRKSTIEYLQAIYDAHNIMGRKLEQRFREQAAVIDAIRERVDSAAAASAADISGIRTDMGRIATASAAAIGSLDTRIDTAAASATDMRAKLSILTAKHDQEQGEERERMAIRSRENLRAFYRQFQMKLEEMFLAYKVLNTGLVTREKDTTDKIAGAIGGAGAIASALGPALELAGDLVPIPFINTAVKVAGWLSKTVVSKGLAYAGKSLEMSHDRKVKAQTKLIAGLVENVTIMDREIEQAARALTWMYEPQLSKLTVDGSKMLAECGVRRFLEYARAERASDRIPLSDQIIEAIATFQSHLGTPPWTNKHIGVLAGVAGPWTDSGIYQESGIETKVGRKYTKEGVRVDKYGYRLADDTLAIKLGFH